MDIYNAWPNTQRTAFTGRAPEDHGMQRNLKYTVEGDGKLLAKGSFGAWILGEGKVDVDITGIRKLTLSSATQHANRSKTLFWKRKTVNKFALPIFRLSGTTCRIILLGIPETMPMAASISVEKTTVGGFLPNL